MLNPIKGNCEIRISGKLYPLIFDYDAIAKVEAARDQSILEIQERIERIDVLYDLLEAGLGGAFTKKELSKADLPPVLEIGARVRQAILVAYFGDKDPEAKPKGSKNKKKPTKPKSPRKRSKR